MSNVIGGDPGADRLGLEAIGMPLALSRSFVWTNSEVLLAFDLHGGVDHDADQFRQEIQALLLLSVQVIRLVRYNQLGRSSCAPFWCGNL